MKRAKSSSYLWSKMAASAIARGSKTAPQPAGNSNASSLFIPSAFGIKSSQKRTFYFPILQYSVEQVYCTHQLACVFKWHGIWVSLTGGAFTVPLGHVHSKEMSNEDR